METGDLSQDPAQMEAVPCKVGHTYLLALLEVFEMSVVLWIWANLRSA